MGNSIVVSNFTIQSYLDTIWFCVYWALEVHSHIVQLTLSMCPCVHVSMCVCVCVCVCVSLCAYISLVWPEGILPSFCWTSRPADWTPKCPTPWCAMLSKLPSKAAPALLPSISPRTLYLGTLWTRHLRVWCCVSLSCWKSELVQGSCFRSFWQSAFARDRSCGLLRWSCEPERLIE